MKGLSVLKKRNGFAGIYVHFPYCIHKCSYCDFFSIGIGKSVVTNQTELFEAYKSEIRLRIEENLDFSDYSIDSIYFGGGTPSLAETKLLGSFLSFLYKNFKIMSDAEISIEANPENVDREFLNDIHLLGFNRINVGIQSFQEGILKYLDRYYDSQKYSHILSLLENSPFDRTGIDLIYGIPGQTLDLFYQDVDTALKSNIEHLSIYGLTVEENTPYQKLLTQKKILPPNEEMQKQVLLELPKKLESSGFFQYEVSNYSKKGGQSIHNLKYWTLEHYIGIGPGAHGYTKKGRYSNEKSIPKYFQKQFQNVYEPFQAEDISLTLFRIFLPIEIESFLNIIPEKKSAIKSKLYEWEKQGHCSLNEEIFCWNPKSVLFLDDFIFQLACL